MGMSGNIDVISITTPLPAGSFVITALNGAEQLNRPFEYTVQLTSGSVLLDPNTLLDQPVTVSLGDPTGKGRYISGIVATVRQMPYASAQAWRYSLTVVPKLWFLGQTRDCRFYHNQTVPQIVEAILDKFSVAYTDNLQGTYTARDYTVMFNESYLDFIQRLLEDEGIFYYFSHTASSHSLVLADQKSAFTSIANPQLMLQDSAVGWSDLSALNRQDTTALGSVTVDDYNPETNQLASGTPPLRGTEPTVLQATGAANRTHYTWPAVRGTNDDATARAKWRIQAAEAAAQMYAGSGGSPDFIAGSKFNVSNDPLGINDYVIHKVEYTVADTADGAGAGGASRISMDFTAFPASADWREEPTVAPPVMAGLYTGLVIGADGEEIYVDDLGRIKVWFPWDNAGDIQPDTTFWARVVQPWAGVAWGTQFIPRVGMEVAIAFLEGDVNRPVVVGSLYNGNNTPVFKAADKNKSGIRTHSTKGGGASNYNELSFDDTMGSEVFFLHAEKDYTLEVEHDQTLKIDNCRIVTVTKDETVTVKGKQAITVTGDQSLTVEQGNRAVTVSSGNETLDVSAGSITHKAMQSITLQVGSNSLKIDATGITLTATMIKLAANAMVDIAGSGMTKVDGGGLLKLTGAIVMVN
jgi:type VI secretion system secreted protein VgrG